MNEVPPAKPLLITFIARNQRRCLPVTFGAKPVAVCHQALHGDTGQLRHAVQILECIRERVEAPILQERTHSEFDCSRLA